MAPSCSRLASPKPRCSQHSTLAGCPAGRLEASGRPLAYPAPRQAAAEVMASWAAQVDAGRILLQPCLLIPANAPTHTPPQLLPAVTAPSLDSVIPARSAWQRVVLPAVPAGHAVKHVDYCVLAAPHSMGGLPPWNDRARCRQAPEATGQSPPPHAAAHEAAAEPMQCWQPHASHPPHHISRLPLRLLPCFLTPCSSLSAPPFCCPLRCNAGVTKMGL